MSGGDRPEMGAHGRFCVIRDPAGAVAALFTPARLLHFQRTL